MINFEFGSDDEIVCGEAKGPDTWGRELAERLGLQVASFPADWDTYSKFAGYKRNEDMAKYAAEGNGYLVAYWDGKSKGTKHMIRMAQKYNLGIEIVLSDEPTEERRNG